MRRIVTHVLVGGVITLCALGAALTAWAAFSGSGTGPSSTKAQLMPAGNAPNASAASGSSSVLVSWTQASFPVGGAGVTGYVVTRYNASNVAQTTGVGCSGVIAGLSCTESSVPDGVWTYTVTPAQGLWRGAPSASSASVSVSSCSKTFIQPGLNQSWFVAANWSTGALPTTGDLVCIPNLGGSVVFATSTASVARVVASQPLTVNSGSLTITSGGAASSFSTLVVAGGTTTFDNAVAIASLTHSNGTVAGSGAVTTTAGWLWSGGTQSGTGSTTASPGSTFTSSGTRTLVSRTVVNQTTANWAASSAMNMTDGVFQNEGILNLSATTTFGWVGGTPKVSNRPGALINQTTVGVVTVGFQIHFDNDGTVTVTAGTFSINYYNDLTLAGIDAGAYNVASGATLGFDYGHRTVTGPTVSSGTVRFSGSVFTQVTFTGSYTSTVTQAFGGAAVFNNGSVTMGTLTQSGGEISGTAAVTISTSWQWSSGDQTGTGSTTASPGSTFTIAPGASREIFERTISNQTTANWSGASVVLIGGTFRNEATLNVTSTSSLGNGSGRVENRAGAVINKTGAATFSITQSSSVVLSFDNDGTINVNAGTLEVKADSAAGLETGTTNVASGATLRYLGGSRTISGATTSSGTVTFAGASVTMTGAYTSPVTTVSGGVATFNNGTVTMPTLTQTGGDVSGTAAISITTDWHWSGIGGQTGTGSTTVLPGSVFWIDASNQRSIVNRTVINQTTATWWTTASILMNGATFQNEGVLNLEFAAAFVSFGPPSAVKNMVGATINVNLIPFTTFSVAPAFDNDGTVNVLIGTLTVGGPPINTDTGTYNVTAGTDLVFNSGRTISQLVAAGNASLNGAAFSVGTLKQTGGTVASTAPVTITSLWQWSAGTHSGVGTTTVALAATFTIDTAGVRTLSGGRNVVTQSTNANWTGSSAIGLSSASFQNSGTLNLAAAAGFTAGGGTTTFKNLVGGTINNTTVGTFASAVAFDNAGTLNVSSGVFSTAGAVPSSGTIFVTGQLTVGGTLTLSAGTLRGAGTVQATTINNTGASVAPGAVAGATGTLTVTGAYTQSGTGRLTVDVVGASGPTDVLQVSGAVTVGGVLSITTTGTAPPSGTAFAIVLGSSVSGTFSSIVTAGGTNYTATITPTTANIVSV